MVELRKLALSDRPYRLLELAEMLGQLRHQTVTS